MAVAVTDTRRIWQRGGASGDTRAEIVATDLDVVILSVTPVLMFAGGATAGTTSTKNTATHTSMATSKFWFPKMRDPWTWGFPKWVECFYNPLAYGCPPVNPTDWRDTDVRGREGHFPVPGAQ